MIIRLTVGISVYEIVTRSLLQVGILPDHVWDLLSQYPPLLAVIIVAYYMHKMQKEENAVNREWLDQMLESQRGSLKEVYSTNQTFLLELISQFNTRQDEVAADIKLIENQLKVNNATVGEVSTLHLFISDLIEKISDLIEKLEDSKN